MPGLDLLLMLVVFVGAAYFLMIRPQRGRMCEHQSQTDALLPGARVILDSGIFAAISHIADTQAIVGLAPGVEVTTLKQAITRVTRDDEEEFEFTGKAEETPENEENKENVDGVDAPEPEDTSATREPVSERN